MKQPPAFKGQRLCQGFCYTECSFIDKNNITKLFSCLAYGLFVTLDMVLHVFHGFCCLFVVLNACLCIVLFWE